MGNFKGVLVGVYRGVLDSLAGFYLIFTISTGCSGRRHTGLQPRHESQCPLALGCEYSGARSKRSAAARHRPSSLAECKCTGLNSHTRANNTGRSSNNAGGGGAVSASSLRQRMLQCCMLNGGVLLTSMLVFQHVLLPLLHLCVLFVFGEKAAAVDSVSVWSTVSAVLTWTFSTLWLVPIFFISRIINCIWFQDIADDVFRQRQGRAVCSPLSLSVFVADSLFSVFAQVLFLLQGTLSMYLVPVASIGRLVHTVHMCLLYSLYAFEYRWYHMGWELHRRLVFVETEWPYFVGFGLPLALATQTFSSYLMNGCVFSVLFPVLIVSGTEAVPASGLCDFPLHLFTPVIMLSNAFFRKSVAVSRGL